MISEFERACHTLKNSAKLPCIDASFRHDFEPFTILDYSVGELKQITSHEINQTAFTTSNKRIILAFM